MKKWEAILLSIIILSGCKKPYNPPATASPGSYLVVEGVINAGADSTVITLSKTVSLSSASGANPVLNAVVTVESNKNNVYPLTDAGHGKYFSAGLNLDNTLQYRLNIKTSNNEQYQSAFQAVAITPPIDSLGFVIQNTPTNTGIQVYLNTHDPSNKTKYYR